MTGLKRKDITKCACCERGVMQGGSLTFYKLTVEHHLVDIGAVRRQHGLELMMGHPGLASIMGPDEDLTTVIDRPRVVLVCQDCAAKSLLDIMED